MNKTITAVFIVALIGIAGFFYLTRPIAVPTEDIETVSQKMPVGTSPVEGEIYRIEQDKSTASFSITEMLSNKPFTAVGTTNQVAGDISINGNVLIIGEIKIDARTFKTDSNNRDGAINRFILESDVAANNYITFTPTSITGVPQAIIDGAQMDITVTGNLTISGITKPATFTGSIIKSATNISGSATASISRSDYDLTIPSIPFVANVATTFPIKMDFVAGKIAQ